MPQDGAGAPEFRRIRNDPHADEITREAGRLETELIDAGLIKPPTANRP